MGGLRSDAIRIQVTTGVHSQGAVFGKALTSGKFPCAAPGFFDGTNANNDPTGAQSWALTS